MNPRFRVPIGAMLAGLAFWGVLVAAHSFSTSLGAASTVAAVCLVSAGLIVFSGFTCLKARGPAVGQVVRLALLAAMSTVTYLIFGLLPALLLAAGVALEAVLVVAVFTTNAAAELRS